MSANLYANLPDATGAEVFTELFARTGVRIERIVSLGQATPEDAPMVQDQDEWVVLLTGGARLRIDGEAEQNLAPGDWMWIPRGTVHWVTWTDPDMPSIWLAVHLE
ncbi:cupin domain-containing protein [Sphingosinithalassobacter portus]|uniref:cupin domain-containing protein n=1 Tax=Stakelama portus TaxID=2676234 RepID=UPI000D6E36D3|nr:cupin domain-containing protein [Sphingosinithalassobacter portus]